MRLNYYYYLLIYKMHYLSFPYSGNGTCNHFSSSMETWFFPSPFIFQTTRPVPRAREYSQNKLNRIRSMYAVYAGMCSECVQTNVIMMWFIISKIWREVTQSELSDWHSYVGQIVSPKTSGERNASEKKWIKAHLAINHNGMQMNEVVGTPVKG